MDLQGVSPIGQQVARYRKAAKMSAEELAQKAGEGLTRSVIANLENGRKDDVTVKQLMALAAALHVPPLVLIADVFDPGARSPYPIPEWAGLYQNFGDLLLWISAEPMGLFDPDANPATELAAGAVSAIRWYLRAVGSLRSTVSRYANLGEVTNEHQASEEGFLYDMIRSDAETVFQTIDSMRQRGIKVSDAAITAVHKTLADVGLKYKPLPESPPGYEHG